MATTVSTAAKENQQLRNAAERRKTYSKQESLLKEVVVSLAATQVAVNEVTEVYTTPAEQWVWLEYIAGRITDIDTNGTPTAVFKISVGATDVLTGITAGQTGSAAGFATTLCLGGSPKIAPNTKITVTFTTGAATAAAGTLTLYVRETTYAVVVPPAS